MGPPPTPKFIHELMVIHKKVSTVHTTHKPFATWDEPPEYCLASPLWCKTGDREERHTGKKGCKKNEREPRQGSSQSCFCVFARASVQFSTSFRFCAPRTLNHELRREWRRNSLIHTFDYSFFKESTNLATFTFHDTYQQVVNALSENYKSSPPNILKDYWHEISKLR